MARATFPTYSARDFTFTVAGVCTFLCDVGSDLCVARDLYTRGHWLWFGVFMGCLLVSSVIVQMFSWLWLQYDRDLEDFDAHVTAGSPILFGGDKQMTRALLLHVCQLGFFCRHMSAIWQGFRVWRHGGSGSEYAVYMTHDLSMLRLIETFCESAPQLTLMIYIMLRSNHARVVQCVSVVASTTSIAWMVVDYHRSLRSFLPDKDKQAWTSSLIYFLWNLLLIGPRVASIALFASVLPCLIAGHFLLLWIVFVSWAWRQRTDFMDSAVGEWLYRSIIGVIWYFSWFNVAEGHTRGRSIIYHSFIIADSVVLLVTWWCYRDSEVIQAYALIVIICIPLAYVVGLLIKVLYYNCFHPKLWRPVASGKVIDDVSDGMKPFSTVQTDSASVHVSNKRMGRHAANFYTSVFKTNRSKESNESVL